MKELQKNKLPDAVDNMYLVARRIQARFAQIPNRPVSKIYDTAIMEQLLTSERENDTVKPV